MVYGADTVSIAATTAGVTGTITVPEGAHLRNITIGFTQVNTGTIVTIIELTWAQSPTPLRFTPNQWSNIIGTSVTGGQVNMIPDENCMIPLDVVVSKATVVTVKATSTANQTVYIGLEWD